MAIPLYCQTTRMDTLLTVLEIKSEDEGNLNIEDLDINNENDHLKTKLISKILVTNAASSILTHLKPEAVEKDL